MKRPRVEFSRTEKKRNDKKHLFCFIELKRKEEKPKANRVAKKERKLTLYFHNVIIYCFDIVAIFSGTKYN